MLYSKDRIVPIKHRKNIDTSLSCPRCHANYKLLYLFGHDGKFQKLRCTKCLRQFTPDKPTKPKKEPKLFCPICGRGAHVTHVLGVSESDAMLITIRIQKRDVTIVTIYP